MKAGRSQLRAPRLRAAIAIAAAVVAPCSAFLYSRHAVQALHHRVPAGWDEQHREGGNQLARSVCMEHLSVWSRLTLRRLR